MKFFNLLLLTILGLFKIFSAKNAKAKKHPSQGTRNYRKVAPDPSYNPLPNSWQTGPRNNFGGGHNAKKYGSYSSRIADYHQYHDSTQQLKNRVTQ